jgi:hypothetical protein
MSTKVITNKIARKENNMDENNMSDEEIMTILKKDMCKYASMMINAKNNFKNLAMEEGGDKKLIQNRLEYLTNEYQTLKNDHKNLEKKYNQLEERTKKTKQIINNTDELGIINIEDEIKQFEKEKELYYKERKDKDLEEFKKLLGK